MYLFIYVFIYIFIYILLLVLSTKNKINSLCITNPVHNTRLICVNDQ